MLYFCFSYISGTLNMVYVNGPHSPLQLFLEKNEFPYELLHILNLFILFKLLEFPNFLLRWSNAHLCQLFDIFLVLHEQSKYKDEFLRVSDDFIFKIIFLIRLRDPLFEVNHTQCHSHPWPTPCAHTCMSGADHSTPMCLQVIK